MAETSDDITLWENLKKTILPFHSKCKKADMPPRLRVHRGPQKTLPCFLDLHQMTIQEAYDKTLSFLEQHFRLKTKKIQIITGKGHEGAGVIRHEFNGWLDTQVFKRYIQRYEWTHDQGAINLWLKKNK